MLLFFQKNKEETQQSREGAGRKTDAAEHETVQGGRSSKVKLEMMRTED